MQNNSYLTLNIKRIQVMLRNREIAAKTENLLIKIQKFKDYRECVHRGQR